MERFLKAVGSVILILLLVNIAIWLLFRAGSDRFLNALRGFNKRCFNPVMLRFAGSKGFYAAAIRHSGRVSGRSYATPVLAESTPDGFIILLPYGTRVDWLRNVQGSGSAELVTGGTSVAVDRPELISVAEAHQHLPLRLQRRLDRYGVVEYLRLYVADRELSALADRP